MVAPAPASLLAPRAPPRAAVDRPLNEIEYFNWCIGQPYNMVVELQLRGELSPERLRGALALAQVRHPLLAVNTEPGPDGLPRFTSEGVGELPLAVFEDAGAEPLRAFVESELVSTFVMDVAAPSRPPLMRVALFRPRTLDQPTGLVFTAQHVIADGLSMMFLVRDLLRFLAQPEAPVTPLEATCSPDLLPVRVRRRIPTTTWRFRIALLLAKVWTRLRFGASPPERATPTHRHRSWELSADQTERLRARCRREQVSVHAAICTAFLPSFPAIHTPMNLRPQLALPVDEAVGLFIGSADVRLPYRTGTPFWANARRFNRRLRRAMRDPFWVYRLFSRAVPVARVRELGELMVTITSASRPFAVTNLGRLEDLRGAGLEIESLYGAVTGIIESSVLTVYTIGGRMRLHLLAAEEDAAETRVQEEGARAIQRLIDAVDAP